MVSFDVNFVKELATFLVKSNALRFGIFKLSSGKESPYYIDLRLLPSFPKYFKFAINAYRETLAKEPGLDAVDYLCSVPTSGLVYAAALSYETGKPFVYARKEAKGHGTSKMIEGYLSPASRVMIIDDVATTGSSVADAIEAVRGNGGVVEHALVLIDRMEGATEMLRELGVRLHSVARISDIAKILHESGMLEEEVLKAVQMQIKEKA